MYDMNVAARGNMNKEELQAVKERLSNQSWVDAEKGYPEY